MIRSEAFTLIITTVINVIIFTGTPVITLITLKSIIQFHTITRTVAARDFQLHVLGVGGGDRVFHNNTSVSPFKVNIFSKTSFLFQLI